MDNQVQNEPIQTSQNNQPNITFEPNQAPPQPETNQLPEAPPTPTAQAPKKKKSKFLLILVLLLLLLLGGGAAAYMKLYKQKASDKQQTSAVTPQPSPKVEMTPDEAFKKMLENNRHIKTYAVKVAHTAKSRTSVNSDSNMTYKYNAVVDVSKLKEMKLQGTFDLDKPGKQAKGETIWIGEALYTKLSEALVTDYQDVPCSSPGNKTAKSPSLALLKAGYVKTARSDFTLSCGSAAYHDFIDIIQLTNTPFSDFPHLDVASLTELEQRAFKSNQEGQYKLYDGKLDELNGVPAYSFNVLIENFKIIEMSKGLAAAAGYVDDNNHIIVGGSGHGLGSPGRFLTVWIDRETQQLLRVHSKVDTKDVDIKFDTIIDYSKINEPVNIVTPI